MKIIIAVLLSIFFFSCSSQNTINQQSVVSNTKPKWVFNPSLDGTQKGAVGIANLHIKGISSQRKLAISRGVDNIAIQLGVKVSTVQKISSQKKNNTASTSFSSYSVQTVSGKSFSVTVKEFWEDTKTGELYVWITKD